MLPREPVLLHIPYEQREHSVLHGDRTQPGPSLSHRDSATRGFDRYLTLEVVVELDDDSRRYVTNGHGLSLPEAGHGTPGVASANLPEVPSIDRVPRYRICSMGWRAVLLAIQNECATFNATNVYASLMLA